MTTGQKIAAIIEAFNARYEEGAPGYNGGDAMTAFLKVSFEEDAAEPWIVTVEDHSNPHDYGKTHSFSATSFEEAVGALYRDLVG
jgi:hypothetical protein